MWDCCRSNDSGRNVWHAALFGHPWPSGSVLAAVVPAAFGPHSGKSRGRMCQKSFPFPQKWFRGRTLSVLAACKCLIWHYVFYGLVDMAPATSIRSCRFSVTPLTKYCHFRFCSSSVELHVHKAALSRRRSRATLAVKWSTMAVLRWCLHCG